MSFRKVFAGSLVLGAVFSLTPPAESQRNCPPSGPSAQLQPIKTEGTLVSAGPNQLQLSTNTNQTMVVYLAPQTRVSVTGAAEQDYLKSGVCVEFVAEIGKGGTATNKIERLTIISLTGERQPGLFPPEFASKPKKGESGDKADEARPLPPDPGIGEPAAGKGRSPRGKKEADPMGGDLLTAKPGKTAGAAQQFPGTFTVRGTVRLFKNGALTVSPGRGPTIKAEVANDATIDVDMADLRAVQREDRVSVNGMTSPARPNAVLAESVTVELANPLSGVKKRATRPEKPAPRVPAAPGKAAKGGDDPFGGK